MTDTLDSAAPDLATVRQRQQAPGKLASQAQRERRSAVAGTRAGRKSRTPSRQIRIRNVDLPAIRWTLTRYRFVPSVPLSQAARASERRPSAVSLTMR